VDRWLLNTFPTWQLVLMHVGGAILIGVGGFLLMKRFVPSLQANADSRSLSSAFGIATGLFSFVLAFTIGQLYTNFTRSQADARQEASILTQILRSSRGLPPGLALTVKNEVLTYAEEVQQREWRAMEHGHGTVAAWEDIDHMYGTMERHRIDAGDNTYYGETLQRLNDLVVARRTRLDDANIALPLVFQILLLFGSALALTTTFYFKPFGEHIQLVMIAAAATLIGMAMLTALMLDYPYSGTIAVSKTPFNPQTLLLLSGYTVG
jgi:Protein of unknown function (DUF4239)